MDRMYSILEIKSTDEGERIIKGIATTPTPDRVGDIVEPLGIEFKNPMPLLWQHDHRKPVGTVNFDKPTAKGITFEARIHKESEPGALKDRVDEAWQSVKAGLVSAVSIGFRYLEYAFMDGGDGIRFIKSEVMELSLVTIPANPDATITQIRSFDTEVRAAKGIKDGEGRPKPPGATGKTKTHSVNLRPEEGKPVKKIAEQIADLEASRAAKAARMTEIMQKSAEEGRSTDEAEQEEFDALSLEVDAIDADLKRFRALEKATGSSNNTSLTEIKGKTQEEGHQARSAVIVKKAKVLPGTEFARYAMCLLASKGDTVKAFNLAKQHYADSEAIVKTLEFQANGGNLERIMKATVEAGTTLDSTYAAPLVDYQNFTGDFVEFLRPQTIIGQFGANGIPALNMIPFNVRIGGQTSGGNAYWVGEGAPKPLTGFDFTATELRWAKIATIAVLTEELIRFSSPSAERLVRDALAKAVIERMDIDFVDPAKAAVANVSPASILNGISGIPSGGNTADDIRDDVKALWAPFIAARNPPRNAVYLMDSTTALAVSLLQNPLGQSEFPGLTMNGGTFMGVPTIVSDNMPVDSDGSVVALVNASDIWLADDGDVTIDASREASLQMLDNPTNNSATGTPTTMVSMFQTNSVAFRAERFVNWARRRSSGVSYLTGVNWGVSGS